MPDLAEKLYRFPAIVEEHVKHFSPIEWVDFVRSVVIAEQRASMEEHLDQGCDNCLKMLRTWATVLEFARREPFYEPPAAAVRTVESYFFSFSIALKGRSNVRIVRSVFDSCDLGTPNGIRGSAAAPRQLMYSSYSMFIDLRVEQKSGSDWTALTGQVVDAHLTDGILEEIPVVLFSKHDTVRQTTTNQFGEFTFTFKAIGHLGLLLNMKHVSLLLLLPEDLAACSMS